MPEEVVQLTETGKYPVDVGLIAELEIPREHGEAYEFKWGPLFQGEVGRVQLNGNLLVEKKFHDGLQHDPEMGYQFQVKYRLMPVFEFGVQAFGEMEPLGAFRRAEPSLGPGGFRQDPAG